MRIMPCADKKSHSPYELQLFQTLFDFFLLPGLTLIHSDGTLAHKAHAYSSQDRKFVIVQGIQRDDMVDSYGVALTMQSQPLISYADTAPGCR